LIQINADGGDGEAMLLLPPAGTEIGRVDVIERMRRDV
jgi:hypothetical protein